MFRFSILRAALLAAGAAWLTGTSPATAQPEPGNVQSLAAWEGFSADLGVFRPLTSQVTIIDGVLGLLGGYYNLTGIHASLATAYLFQRGWFVIGPRVKVTGGLVESMPLDFTIRTNAIATAGGEIGAATDSWYFYVFGGGGIAWLSAARVGFGRSDSIVPAYDLGAGLRYKIVGNWYAKGEFSYVTLGDQRLGFDYFDPKAFFAGTVAFGFRFGPN